MDEERRLRSLLGALEQFEEMPVGMVSAFLLVALNEGCSLRNVVEMSGKPQSTVSRHLLDLGERNRKGEPGLGLVEWRISPEELRRKEYRLTPKGRVLLQRILGELSAQLGKAAS